METNETQVLMKTNLGNIKLKLYNETPQHRDNFIKLVKEGTYNGLLFHRVIKDFMIQGGDVTSKDAPMSKQLGAGDLGYTVPAEFVYPKYFHKKGALSAARTSDEVNPERESSASQFYIVTGKVYSDSELAQMEKQKEGRLKQSIFAVCKKRMLRRSKQLTKVVTKPNWPSSAIPWSEKQNWKLKSAKRKPS